MAERRSGMGLDEYERKRDFGRTPEPAPEPPREGRDRAPLTFVVQAHAARRMHYDFRLELDGVLLSWAVPKGPSLDPKVRRLAMHTEDHPLEYATFEGTIPKGEYGGGTVLVWDRGTWEPAEDARKGHERGKMVFNLHGEKLRGRFHLVRSGGRRDERGDSWLLIKGRDDAAEPEKGRSIVDERPESVLSGRTLDEVAADPDRVWHSRSAGGPTDPIPDPAEVPGSRRAKLPALVEPQLATLVKHVPAGDEWIHEIKLDGYRILARLEGGEVVMLSRNGKDWTDRMPSVVRALAGLPVESALFDGELVVLDEGGISDFQRLQNSLGEGLDRDVVYYAFDILHLDGRDLRRAALADRKVVLRGLLAATGAGTSESRIRYGDHVSGHGQLFYENACRMGLEGIICKRADQPYRSGRGKDWVKVKCLARQEFVIGGWTEPSGSRSALGALLVGTYGEDGALRYAGKVGTGFTERSLRQVLDALEPLEEATPPFADPPKGAKVRGAHWVRPVKVAEVEFTAFTEDGRLRHPSFKGLREDKPARQIRREEPQPAKPLPTLSPEVTDLTGFRLSNPDRVLYPEQGITKKELALYYAQCAAWMLPHVENRLLTLKRCPTGYDQDCFFQKHAREGMAEYLRAVPLVEKGEQVEYVTLDDVRGLLGLVQLGVLEVHTWGCHVDRVERPDQLVMDLDPGPDVPWERVIEAALRLRDRLDELGLRSFVKTTGGKGLHVVFPIERHSTWDEAKLFCKALAEDLERREPNKYVTTMVKAQRRGKIFIDYLRNARGSTAVAPFSTRALAGAPVSAPLEWAELTPAIGPNHFDVRNLPRRLAQLDRDPWEDYFDVRQRITTPMKRELRMGGKPRARG